MNSTSAEAHRAFAATFTDRVHGVTDWDAPAPVEGWTARTVVEHLTSWFPGVLASGSDLSIPLGPDPRNDPVGAWENQRDAVQAILDDPESAGMPFEGDMGGTVGEMVNQFYTPDVFMHTWDLARATGQDDRLDPAIAQGMFEGMQPMEEMLRASGQFGTARGPLRDDADATDRLVSFIGRDPYWTPPAN